MKTKQHFSIRLISMILIVLIVISNLPIQAHAINYDKRTKIIKSAISKSKSFIEKNPIDESKESFPYETAYETDLTPGEKKIYKLLYKKIKDCKIFKLSTKKYSEFDLMDASTALLKDYPLLNEYVEFGWIMDKTRKYPIYTVHYYNYYITGNGRHKLKDKEMKTKKQLNMLKKKTNQYNKKLDRYADMIVKGMPSGISTIDKYRYLAACLCCITNYNKASLKIKELSESHNTTKNKKAWSYDAAIMYGVCVCKGYAQTYNYLCKKANLYCIEVDGYVAEGYHAWNLVKLAEGTYHVDVTWMDDNKLGTHGWYEYFMCTQKEISSTHKKIDNGLRATGKKSFADKFMDISSWILSHNMASDTITWSASKKNDITVEIENEDLNLLTVEPFNSDEFTVEYIKGPFPKYNSAVITIKGDSETIKKMLTAKGKKLKVKFIFEHNAYSEFTIVRGK